MKGYSEHGGFLWKKDHTPRVLVRDAATNYNAARVIPKMESSFVTGLDAVLLNPGILNLDHLGTMVGEIGDKFRNTHPGDTSLNGGELVLAEALYDVHGFWPSLKQDKENTQYRIPKGWEVYTFDQPRPEDLKFAAELEKKVERLKKFDDNLSSRHRRGILEKFGRQLLSPELN